MRYRNRKNMFVKMPPLKLMMMMFQKAQKNLGSCWTSLLVPVELSGLNFVRRERAIHVDEYEVDHSLILTQKFSDNGYCKQVVNFHVQGQDIVITVLNYEKEHDRFLMNLLMKSHRQRTWSAPNVYFMFFSTVFSNDFTTNCWSLSGENAQYILEFSLFIWKLTTGF